MATKKDNAEIKERIKVLMMSYSIEQRAVISKFFWKLGASTRITGKVSDGIKEKTLLKWQKYDADIVTEALETWMRMPNVTPGMNERYVLGIIRNKQKERDERYGKHKGINQKVNDNSRKEDEGRKLAERFKADGDTVCDY